MITGPEDFTRLDGKSFGAFVAAARRLNFTAAARDANMTQSGVSQHVARLESQLGVPLFHRVNRKLTLAPAGRLLLNFCRAYAEDMDELLRVVRTSQICGRVRYAMPHSCLVAPHFPRLMENRKRLANIELSVGLCPNDTVLEKLSEREIDFGFVSRREGGSSFDFEYFCREEYVLVVGRGMPDMDVTTDSLLSARFVDYPGMRVFFELWMKHHFGRVGFPFERLRIGGQIDSIYGALTMIEHGAGISVLPAHCLPSGRAGKAFRRLKGPNPRPLVNTISLVTLKGVKLPPKVLLVMDLLRATRGPEELA